MRSTTIKTIKLLQIVKENREQHKKDYEIAVEEYLSHAKVQFEKKAEQASNGELVDPSIDAPRPEEFLDHYDQAIRMLELEERDRVELSESEFQRLVMDEWGWANQFESTSGSYL